MGRADYASFHRLVTKTRENVPMTGADRLANGKFGGRSFGSSVATSAHAILADARQTLADQHASDAETVHGLRKAFKRWRALLRLLAKPLGEQADRMRAEGRDLMRALASARDAQSALDALADLEKAADTDAPLSGRSMNTIQRRLTALRDSAEQTGLTEAMRARISHYLNDSEFALEQWPWPTIKFDAVAEGLTTTYRRAREKIPDDWRSADDEHLHDLRRRAVEHRHQMDLIAPLWPRFALVWTEEAQRLRNRLGACQDLTVFNKLMAPHQPLAHWRSRLTPMTEARRIAHLKIAKRLAGRLFAEKPKAFRRRIAALWKARAARTN
jgi:CHAD domain-containing protein